MIFLPIAYAMIGFLIASITIKLFPPTSDGSVFAFIMSWAFWPLIIAIALLYIPAVALKKWVDLLTGTSE